MTEAELIKKLCKHYKVTIELIANAWNVTIDAKDRYMNITYLSIARDSLQEALSVAYDEVLDK